MAAQGLPDYDEWRQRRLHLDLQCAIDPKRRAVEYRRCKEDVNHWLWHWAWIHCPWADEDEQEQMFLPWKFQEELISEWVSGIRAVSNSYSFERRNYIVEKARDMAASWSAVAVAVHDWLFNKGSHLFISYKEDKVDSRDDMDSLFQKMRFIIYRLPDWMLPLGWNPHKHDNKLKLINPESGGVITGETTTKRSSRSGRKRVIWYDELAFFQAGLDEGAWSAGSQSTKMRVGISTPNGMHNLFYRMRTRVVNQETNETEYMSEQGQKVITLYWWKHPLKAQGLREENGKLISPWYLETKRTLDPQTFAREIEIDYRLSQKGWIFDQYTYEHKVRNLRPEPGKPILRGWDAGAHFMVVFMQIDSYGRLLIFKELYFENIPLESIATKVIRVSKELFPDFAFEDFGDPAGASVYTSNQNGNRSEWMELQLKHKIVIRWQFMNRIPSGHRVESRIVAIQKKVGGRCAAKNTPMLLIDDSKCPILDRAFGGEYTRAINSSTGQIMDDVEEAHPIEDGVDCVGYVLLGKNEGGGGVGQTTGSPGVKPKKNNISWRVPS